MPENVKMRLLQKNLSKKFGGVDDFVYLCTRKMQNIAIAAHKQEANMVPVVQLVRASDCGSECRGFESHRAPSEEVL